MKYNLDELSVAERNYVFDLSENLKENSRGRREDGLSKIDVIIKSMIDNKNKIFWHAKDFLYGDCFVGYETTALMSRAMKLYPNLFKAVKSGRYRLLALNWDDKEDLPNFIERFKDLPTFEFTGII